MRVWITNVGLHQFAVINPLWAACFYNKFIPEKVILLNSGFQDNKIKENVQIVKVWLQRILLEYQIEQPQIEMVDADEEDITKFARIFTEIVKNYESHKLAIDMTPGRKFMSSIAMATAFKNKKFVKNLFYLHLWGLKYQNEPFIKIPFNKHKLIDVMELL